MGNTIARATGCGSADDEDEEICAELSSAEESRIEDEAVMEIRQKKAEYRRRINDYQDARLAKFHQQMALQELVNNFHVEINQLTETIKHMIKAYKVKFEEDPFVEEPNAAGRDGGGDESNNETTA